MTRSNRAYVDGIEADIREDEAKRLKAPRVHALIDEALDRLNEETSETVRGYLGMLLEALWIISDGGHEIEPESEELVRRSLIAAPALETRP